MGITQLVFKSISPVSATGETPFVCGGRKRSEVSSELSRRWRRVRKQRVTRSLRDHHKCESVSHTCNSLRTLCTVYRHKDVDSVSESLALWTALMTIKYVESIPRKTPSTKLTALPILLLSGFSRNCIKKTICHRCKN